MPNSNLKRFRPDYRCDELSVIIEFDGYAHYCNSKQIVNDRIKDLEYIKLGYNIFRIPYFIQMTSNILSNLLNQPLYYKQLYPHGFIDTNAILPADFCELGIIKFIDDLERFSDYKRDIISSLKTKCNTININAVLPPSIQYLIT